MGSRQKARSFPKHLNLKQSHIVLAIDAISWVSARFRGSAGVPGGAAPAVPGSRFPAAPPRPLRPPPAVRARAPRAAPLGTAPPGPGNGNGTASRRHAGPRPRSRPRSRPLTRAPRALRAAGPRRAPRQPAAAYGPAHPSLGPQQEPLGGRGDGPAAAAPRQQRHGGVRQAAGPTPPIDPPSARPPRLAASARSRASGLGYSWLPDGYLGVMTNGGPGAGTST